jgi:hypothetical protein
MRFTLWAMIFFATAACREQGSMAIERGPEVGRPVVSGAGPVDVSTAPPTAGQTGAASAGDRGAAGARCPSSTTTPTVLTAVPDAGSLNDLFVDSRGAYLAEGSLLFSTASSTPQQYSTGTIRRVPLEGGQATVLWSGREFAQSVVATDTSVYFALADRGTLTRAAGIYRLALRGGNPTQLASWSADGTATALAYADGQVCWSYTSGTGGSVFCGADGSSPATSAPTSPSAGVLALGSDDVFWPSGGAILAMNRADPSQPPRVVWTGPSTLQGLASLPGMDRLLASDDSTIYRVTPKTMSASVLLRPASMPASLATDGVFVYWTEPTSGTIAAAALDGGAEVSLVSGQKYPTKITVSNGVLYWIDVVSKQVLRTSACSR